MIRGIYILIFLIAVLISAAMVLRKTHSGPAQLLVGAAAALGVLLVALFFDMV